MWALGAATGAVQNRPISDRKLQIADCRRGARRPGAAHGHRWCRKEAGTLQNAELSGGRRGSLGEVSGRFPGSGMGNYSLMFAYVRLCSLFLEKNV